MNLKTKKAIIIDGHSLAYRAFFATSPQLEYCQKNNLQPINALRMMVIMIAKLLNKHQYNYGLVAFDTSRKSFRTEIFQDYKSNRVSMPEELVQQMPWISNALECFGFKILAIENYEADDVIATFAKHCCLNQIENHIFTSDRDLLQLVNKQTSVHILKKGVSEIDIYDINSFGSLTNGLKPQQIIDLKCLAGDSSDNYKGVNGIGPKTALNLIKEFHDVSNLLQNLAHLKPTIQQKIIGSQKEIEIFLKLAKIYDKVEISSVLSDYILTKKKKSEIEDFLTKINAIQLLKFFEEGN